MKHTKIAASHCGKGVWLGMAIFLAGWLGGAGPARGQESAPLSTAKMTVRGPDNGVVGQRFTLEILITNTGGGTLRDLQLLAAMDANLDQKDSGGENLAKVESIAPGKIHIVRLFLTPTKKGPAGVDITLSSKSGEKSEIRHVLPVFPADDAPPQAERPNGASPLKVTITTPRECFADQNGTFLLYVLNTDTVATQDKLDLVVSYASASNPLVFMNNLEGVRPQLPEDVDRAPFQGGKPEGGRFPRRGPVAVIPGTLTRMVHVLLPSLAPNEGRTFPVEITPHRIGKLVVSVTSNGQPVGSTTVQVAFDPKAPIQKLLPGVKTTVTPRLPARLADVPEVSLEEPFAKSANANEGFEHIAHLLDKINFVNEKKADAFVEALQNHRPDLAGMPVMMGHSCRLPIDRANNFLSQLSLLRVAMSNPNGDIGQKMPPIPGDDHGGPARVAAMFQVLGPESLHLRTAMAKHLSAIAHVDATKALAKLAIYSEDEPVRQIALDALKTRRDKDYSDILVQGLNYPWPAVAQRASEAIVKLKRTDLLPQVADVLDRADPRAPQIKDVDGNKVQAVREVVKISHLRNCILCHAPRSPEQNPQQGGVAGGIAVPVLLANVPIPNQPLPTPSFSTGGYGQSSVPDTMIRFDVTYLRQDFSMPLAVDNAAPWPATQRFDFLVRSRVISNEDAQAYRNLLQPAGGAQSPFQVAALSALRQLTGRVAEPNSAAWRKVIEQVRAE